MLEGAKTRDALRLVLVEDLTLVREGIRALLEEQRDLEVVAEAADASGALAAVAMQRPDVVLLEVQLPGTTGAAVARQLMESDPGRRILLLAGEPGSELVTEGLAAGALGWVSKDQCARDLVHAIRMVGLGHSYRAPRMRAVAGGGTPQASAPSEPQRPPARLETLSRREREVLDGVLRGHTNERIAELLGISRRTVETHRAHVLRKLDAHSVSDLFRIAARNGLLRD